MDLLCFQSLLNKTKMLINAKQVAFQGIKTNESDLMVYIELICYCKQLPDSMGDFG